MLKHCTSVDVQIPDVQMCAFHLHTWNLRTAYRREGVCGGPILNIRKLV